MKNVLILASVSSVIDQFNMDNIQILQNYGLNVHIACNFEIGNTSSKERIIKFKQELNDKNIQFHQIDFDRNIFSGIFSNIKAAKQLQKLVTHVNFEFIHCHTPIGGVCGRLIGHFKKIKTIYTAHGFHFFYGAPLINWLIYYPIEKFLSKYTEYLIVINEEDYNLAIKRNFKAQNIKLINGIGINCEKFLPQTKENKMMLRKQYGHTEDDFILIYVAELSKRKHQDLLIEVTSILKDIIPNFKILLVGTGSFEKKYKEQVNNLALKENVYFLGFRNDIVNLLKVADISVSTSRQEGLPVNVMEAMATGMPIVVTNCRGNRSLIKDGINGYVVGLDDKKRFSQMINNLYLDRSLRRKFSETNLNIIKKYSRENIMKETESIYKELLGI